MENLSEIHNKPKVDGFNFMIIYARHIGNILEEKYYKGERILLEKVIF